MDEIFARRLEQLITARAGLQLRPRERETLRATVTLRMSALKLRDTDSYYRLLQAISQDAENEWEQLLARLTNNESYFFRDKGQMALLRERILPELIARNQTKRTLRIWSAGCATGEEPYSLAMLVNELLPQRHTASGPAWEIVILGTDIDGPALEQARRGIYGSWSFRAVEPALQQRYFHRREDGWQVAEVSRSLVTFSKCNLVGESFPNTATGIHDMDLILCRNVFIYFEREAVSAVLDKFAQTLRPGGYLMTGHAETYGQLMEPLQARMFPESVVYQRVNETPAVIANPTGITPAPGTTTAGYANVSGQPLSSTTSRREHPVAQQAVTATSARQASATTAQSATTKRALPGVEVRHPSDANPSARETLPLPTPAANETLLLQARAHADLGRYEEAARACQRLMEEHPFAPEPYELLASIAQEQGRGDDAKLLLKKALYIAPASPSAYLELGAIYESEGDTARARKMRVTALELLQKIPPEAAVGLSGGPNALEWTLHLKQLLAQGA